MELHASYCYMSMAFYFERDDVALPGFAQYFYKLSREEREHAQKLMAFQNKRGGRIVLQDVKKPKHDEWGRGLDALETALALEKNVNQALLDLHKIAFVHKDPQMTDYLEGEFLQEQDRSIKELSDHVAAYKRAGPGLGEYQFDKMTLEKKEEKKEKHLSAGTSHTAHARPSTSSAPKSSAASMHDNNVKL